MDQGPGTLRREAQLDAVESLEENPREIRPEHHPTAEEEGERSRTPSRLPQRLVREIKRERAMLLHIQFYNFILLDKFFILFLIL